MRTPCRSRRPPWRRRWLTAGAVWLACMLPGATRAHQSVVMWTLLHEVDTVLDGTVVDTRPAPGGLWHGVHVNAEVFGDLGAPRINVFVHGDGFSETVQLVPGDRRIFGLVRLHDGAGEFHRRLLGSLASIAPGEPGGLAAPDAFIDVEEDTAKEVATVLGPLILLSRKSTPFDREDLDRLILYLDDPRPFIRDGALQILAREPDSLTAAVRKAIPPIFRAEVRSGSSLQVLRSYLNLVRLHEIEGCGEAICDLLIHSEDTEIVEESLQTLPRHASEDATERLLEELPAAGPGKRGRLLRALAKLEWPGTIDACLEALREDERDLSLQAVEALGDIRTGRATRLLLDCLETRSVELRRLVILSLARQDTEASRQALERLAGALDSPAELRAVRRALDMHLRALNTRSGD